MVLPVTTFEERHGVTREQLRREISERQRERNSRAARIDREQLLRLGDEIRAEGAPVSLALTRRLPPKRKEAPVATDMTPVVLDRDSAVALLAGNTTFHGLRDALKRVFAVDENEIIDAELAALDADARAA